ncbi:uncharacterized protein K452DRAFT_311088 [Aplosporella prunicola CBS 121167]|uniref:BTB domain-containing protein n=1 Tax=Aplosporella prunicola CBS 121167 TaxID=1176127 RepID=A0A6A6B9K3_9PEZI|nr:uncharacterized protein K452DRAFT_311088 [Aplosporella prunicola CBS 121167]KAF2139161.1 hypothetical protein K452DRAFT_311088 [Aplosporella prunicola CBS 121167]
MSEGVDRKMLGAEFGHLLDSGIFSDFVIRCHNKEYRVHRNILSAQSKFFENVCKPESGFKESQSSSIDLNDENPEIVKAMLDYLYRFKYDLQNASNDPTINMLFHTRVYAAGEFYGIEKLKHAAIAHFRKLASHFWQHITAFTTAIKSIYNTTHSGDRGLRAIVVEFAVMYMDDLALHDEFLDCMREEPDFWMEVTLKIQEKRTEAQEILRFIGKFNCPKCSAAVYQEISAGKIVAPRSGKTHCSKCGKESTVSDWTKQRIKF